MRDAAVVLLVVCIVFLLLLSLLNLRPSPVFLAFLAAVFLLRLLLRRRH